MTHPISGPISPEELQALAELPYGRAAVELQKHDPLWGTTSGDAAIKTWKVTVNKADPMKATVFVQAPTEAGARSLVNAMEDWEFDWEPDYTEDFEIWSVEVDA